MKMGKAKELAIVITTLVGLSACSSSDSDSGGVASVFEGAWASGCIVDESGEYSILEPTFAGTAFKGSQLTSDNADCSTPFLKTTSIGSFVVGEGLEVPGRALAYPVDITTNQLLAQPLDAQTAADFNATSQCGITNWAANVDFDVSDCLAATGGQTLPIVSYNLYMIEGNQLFSGNSVPQEANRPTSVSLVPDYTRK